LQADRQRIEKAEQQAGEHGVDGFHLAKMSAASAM
jgi:hypothetical protein